MPTSSTTAAAPTIYLTPQQAAEVVNLSPKTLEKMRSIGGGPRFRKLGRCIRYTRADVDAWADSRAYDSTFDPNYPSRGRL